jgi:glycosyltransferase involved in cell wall biosynthesis
MPGSLEPHRDGVPPLVSIITPSFNGARHLEACIRSVENQTYPSIEHLVIDGGSTDETHAILARHPHLRVTIGPDAGMYDALNKGIREARGMIVATLNTDDAYEPEAIAQVVRHFEVHRLAEVVFGDALFMNEQGQPQYIYRGLNFNWKRYVSMRASSLVTPAVFWKRAIHDRIGYFDDTFRMAADFEFFTRFKHLEVHHLPRILVRFRLHEHALTYRHVALGQIEKRRVMEQLGIGSGLWRRTSERVAQAIFLLCCFRPPFVMLRRAWQRAGAVRQGKIRSGRST